MEHFTTREQLVELVNKLFIFTDHQEWQKLQTEVFAKNVFFDMSSAGGEKGETTAEKICNTWGKGYENIDAGNHLA